MLLEDVAFGTGWPALRAALGAGLQAAAALGSPPHGASDAHGQHEQQQGLALQTVRMVAALAALFSGASSHHALELLESCMPFVLQVAVPLHASGGCMV